MMTSWKNFRPALLLALSLVHAAVLAGDFDWIENINVQAQADAQGVKLTIASQLDIAGTDIDLVWSNTSSAGDAAAVLALWDASGRPVNDVLSVYRSQKGQGWGRMAQSLGIQPGSGAFHRLKTGYYDAAFGPSRSKGKGKNK